MYVNELYHHGIKGQRWGVRRYRNEDGSLTPAGKKHEARMERYRAKETRTLVLDYDKTRTREGRKVVKAKKRLDAAGEKLAKGKISEQKYNKAQDKYLDAVTRLSFKKAMYLAERSRIRDMTVDELSKEQSAVRGHKLAAYGSMLAAGVTAAIGGVGIYAVPHTKEFKSSRRLSDESINAATRYAQSKRQIAKSNIGRPSSSTSMQQYRANVRRRSAQEYPVAQQLRDSLNISDGEWLYWGG